MKKLLAVRAVVAVLGFIPATSQAHDHDDWGWFAAGAAAGVITGAVLSDASYHSHCDGYYERPVYYERPSYGCDYGYYRPARHYCRDEYYY